MEYKKQIGKYLLTEKEIKEAEMYIYDEYGVVSYTWGVDKTEQVIQEYWKRRGKPENLENEEH